MDIYPTKTCKCCGVSKEISLFNKKRANKDGLQPYCKDCNKAQSKAHQQANKEEINAQRRADYQANPEKAKARSKAYREANPEKKKASRKAYNEAHKDDPSFIVMKNQSPRISIALNGIKLAAPAKELVGGWNELVAHLESQFEDWMTWDNYGPEWHIDHIKPCASFDFNDPEQQHECFHWTNTRPLRASENLSKGSKVC